MGCLGGPGNQHGDWGWLFFPPLMGIQILNEGSACWKNGMPSCSSPNALIFKPSFLHFWYGRFPNTQGSWAVFALNLFFLSVTKRWHSFCCLGCCQGQNQATPVVFSFPCTHLTASAEKTCFTWKSFSESPLRSPKIMDLLKCEYLLYAALTFSQLLLGKFCKMFSIFQKSQVTYPAENAFKSIRLRFTIHGHSHCHLIHGF